MSALPIQRQECRNPSLGEFLATIPPKWAEIIRLTLEPVAAEDPDGLGEYPVHFLKRAEIAAKVGLSLEHIHHLFTGKTTSNNTSKK